MSEGPPQVGPWQRGWEPDWAPAPEGQPDGRSDGRPTEVVGGRAAAPTPEAVTAEAVTVEAVTAEVRRRRRALVLGAVGVVLAYVLFLAAVSLVWRAWPTPYAWVLLALVLAVAAGSLWPLRTPEDRAAWDERTRRLVRVDAALRDHVSLGEVERDDVTAAAQHRHQLAGPAWFGYPLLVLFVAFLLFNADAVSTPVAWIGTLAAAVLGGLGLLRSHRRDVEAKRWLADPLPPEAPLPPER